MPRHSKCNECASGKKCNKKCKCKGKGKCAKKSKCTDVRQKASTTVHVYVGGKKSRKSHTTRKRKSRAPPEPAPAYAYGKPQLQGGWARGHNEQALTSERDRVTWELAQMRNSAGAKPALASQGSALQVPGGSSMSSTMRNLPLAQSINQVVARQR